MTETYDFLFYAGAIIGAVVALLVVPLAAHIGTSRHGIFGMLITLTLAFVLWLYYPYVSVVQATNFLKPTAALGGYLTVLYVVFVFVPAGMRLMFVSSEGRRTKYVMSAARSDKTQI